MRLNRHIYLVIFFFISSNTWAQTSLMSFSPDARSIGLGRSGVVENVDPSALYWNPALLAYLNTRQTMVSVNQPFFTAFAGYAHFFPTKGSLAFNIARTERTDQAVEFTSFGWGSRFGRHLSLGITLSGLQIGQEGWTTAGVGILFKPAFSLFETDSTHNDFLDSFLTERITLGLCVQNIPLVITDYDHQVRFGLSYALFPQVFRLVYARHFHRSRDTSHFGLLLTPFRTIELFAGLQDFDMEQAALGAVVPFDNINIGFTYDLYAKRGIITASFRIGPNQSTLAEREYNKACDAIDQQNIPEALRLAKRALVYNESHKGATVIINGLGPSFRSKQEKIAQMMSQANSYIDQGHYMTAAALYRKVLILEPTNEKAGEAIESITPMVDENTKRWFEKGMQKYTAGDLDSAKTIFNLIILANPDHRASQEYIEKIAQQIDDEATEHYYTGIGYYNQNDYQKAEEELKKTLEIDPTYSDAHFYLDNIDMKIRKNKDTIAQLYREAVALHERGQLSEARANLMQILNIESDHPQSNELLKEVDNDIESFVQRQVRRGEAAFEKRDLVTAKSAFQRVIRFKPQNDKARRYLNRISAEYNDRTDSYLSQARQFLETGQFVPALAKADSALKINPALTEVKAIREKVLVKIEIDKLVDDAQQKFLSGYYIDALALFDRALTMDSTNVQIKKLRESCQSKLDEDIEKLFNNGLLLYTEEKYSRAIQEWDKVLDIYPNHSGASQYKKMAIDRLEALKKLSK